MHFLGRKTLDFSENNRYLRAIGEVEVRIGL
jgi:hypothetical protein